MNIKLKNVEVVLINLIHQKMVIQKKENVECVVLEIPFLLDQRENMKEI